MLLADLPGSAQQFLDDFVAQMQAIGAIIPEMVYVGAGIVPWDAEALVLTLGTIYQGQPGAPIGSTFNPADTIELSIEMFILLTRPTPVPSDGQGQPIWPSIAEMNDAGLVAFSDASALTRAAINLHDAYLDVDPGQGFVIGNVSPLGPDGGLQGLRIKIDVSLS